MKILIADDELPARGELKYELSTIPNVKIVGECSNGKSVLDFLKTHPNVDLIFLDIEMPVMNGLETAKKIGEMDIPAKLFLPPVTASLPFRRLIWKLLTTY